MRNTLLARVSRDLWEQPCQSCPGLAKASGGYCTNRTGTITAAGAEGPSTDICVVCHTEGESWPAMWMIEAGDRSSWHADVTQQES